MNYPILRGNMKIWVYNWERQAERCYILDCVTEILVRPEVATRVRRQIHVSAGQAALKETTFMTNTKEIDERAEGAKRTEEPLAEDGLPATSAAGRPSAKAAAASASETASRGSTSYGKIARTASPMNFSTSPEWPSMASVKCPK